MTKASDNVFAKLLLSEVAAPATPASGQLVVYAKTDGNAYQKNDAGTETGLAGGGGSVNAGTPYEIDYVEFTSPVTVTATTEATANTLVTASAESFDGSTIAVIEFWAPLARAAASSGANMEFTLYDGSSSIGVIGRVTSQAATSMFVPVHLIRRLTPSNASHTYSLRAFVSTGSGNVTVGAGGSGNYMPGFIRISKLTA